MKTIDEDIKNGTFRQCYLLYGEETYLKNQYRDKLMRAAAAQGDTMNVSSFEGKDVSPAALVDLAETLPFFAERRVILVQDSGFFKNSNDKITDYLSDISPSTCLIFVESEVDKRTKAFKAAKKAGAAAEFGIQKEALITRWILGRLAKEHKKITRDTMQFFIARTGFDMGNIDKELEKLLCYTLGNDVIETADVAAVVTARLENRIFEMVDAIAGHRQAKALELYSDLLALKEAPMRILYLLIRQFRILAETKELAAKGCGASEIAQKIKVPEFAARKNMAQAKGFLGQGLLLALKDGAELEEAVKTGRINDKIAVEILIVKYSEGMSH